jgi:hypothetical protein
MTMPGRPKERDLMPLPPWRQKWNRFRVNWVRTKNQRRIAYLSLIKLLKKGLTLAVSVLGAMLISFGAYQIYAPVGYVTGGLLCWVLVWSSEQDRGGRE